MPKIRGKPIYLPHTVMENIVDLHGAIDPDTGHLICHYYAIAPVIVEIGGVDFPGINVGECLTLVPGEKAANKALEEAEPVKIGELDTSKGVDGVRVDPASLALALGYVRYAEGSMKLLVSKDKGSLIVLYEGEGDNKIVLIVWPCKKRESHGAVLQV